MERGRSLPPGGNAFWSEMVQAEWGLRKTRPVDLPVPDDEIEDEVGPEVPIQDQSMSHGGARGREPSRPKRSEKFSTPESWMERGNLGAGKKSSGLLPEEDDESRSWLEVQASGSDRKTEGPHPESMGTSRDGGDLQRELEKELVDKLKEENEKLQQELQFWRAKSTGGRDGERKRTGSPIPPPPPMMSPSLPRDEKRRFESEHQRFTPDGTRVPSLPPPLEGARAVPPWPLEHYDGCEAERVWKEMGWNPSIISRREAPGHGTRQPQLHHEVLGGGAGRPRLHHEVHGGGSGRTRQELPQREESMNEILTSVQARAVWLERELEAMKRTLAKQPVVKFENGYWTEPVKRHEKIDGPQAGFFGEGLHQDRACGVQQPAGFGEDCQRDRASWHQPQSRVLGEERHQDRASWHQPQSRVLGHQDRAGIWQQPAGLGDLGGGERGDEGSYHEDRLLRQQHPGRSGSDPKGWNGTGGGRKRGTKIPRWVEDNKPNTPEVANANVKKRHRWTCRIG